MTDDDLELLGQIVDRLDSLTYATQLPVPAEIHLKGMVSSIESIRDELKTLVVGRIKEMGGESPWGDE